MAVRHPADEIARDWPWPYLVSNAAPKLIAFHVRVTDHNFESTPSFGLWASPLIFGEYWRF